MPAKVISRIDAPLDLLGRESGSDRAIDQLCINTIRTLAMDAVQQANSGHPGTPMALAPLVFAIWQNFLRFNPEDPIWPNRDRFVLSNGHASMLLYAVLHLSGVKAVNSKYEPFDEPAVSLDDIKRFRQLGSKCPGHPEYHLTSGVETTTGPLGQGCGNSVGMALAGRWLAQHFNRPDFTMFDHDVYVICGDGDMMEGVSSEAASLAGHQMLGNLCWAAIGIWAHSYACVRQSRLLRHGFAAGVALKVCDRAYAAEHRVKVNAAPSRGVHDARAIASMAGMP